VPYGIEGWVGGAYVYIGQPERCVEWCRAQLARGRDTHTLTRAALVIALKIAGSEDEAMAATKGLIDAAEVTRNPHVLSFTLVAYGTAFRDADPDRAREAMRRGRGDKDSGNRANETHLAANLARLEAEHGDPLAALDHVTLAIRNYHDSGSTTTIRALLANLAALFNRLGHYEVAAIMSGFADMPYTRSVVAEISTAIIHLRDVLGDQTYQSLARKGETMTTAEMATYAYDQIDQARAELNAVSK
jgi:hypothetical protein